MMLISILAVGLYNALVDAMLCSYKAKGLHEKRIPISRWSLVQFFVVTADYIYILLHASQNLAYKLQSIYVGVFIDMYKIASVAASHSHAQSIYRYHVVSAVQSVTKSQESGAPHILNTP